MTKDSSGASDPHASTVVKNRPDPSETVVPGFEIVVGPQLGRKIFVGEEVQIIGRDGTSDITLEGSGVSRQHARVSRLATGAVLLEDLGSTNGLYVNGRRAEATVLRSGDRIEIGTDVIIRFGLEEEPVSKVPTANLSPRQHEVARLVAKGLSNAEVGKELFISEATVARHMANMFSKLGLNSRTALTRYMIDHGLA